MENCMVREEGKKLIGKADLLHLLAFMSIESSELPWHSKNIIHVTKRRGN